MPNRTVFLLLFLSALGCSRAPKDFTEPPVSLRNAEEEESEQAAAMATRAEVGSQFRLRGLDIVVDSITVVEEPDSPDRPFLVAHVRVENRTDSDTVAPEISIVCAGSDDSGGFLAYSTYVPGDAVPALSYRDGFAWLTGPGDPRTGEVPADCAAPAYLRVSVEGETARVDVDGDLVAALNDEGCSSRGSSTLADATILAPPVVCATFGDGIGPLLAP